MDVLPAVGQVLPSAVGVAVSPIPVAAIVLILATRRGRSNGAVFALGWVVGLTVVTTVVLALTSGAATSSTTSDTIGVGKVLLGVALIALGAAQWRKRPTPGERPETPAWMATLDDIAPPRAGLLGLGLSGANPKNLALSVAAATSISQAGLDAGGDVVAATAFVAIGSSTVLGAVLASLLAPSASRSVLAEVRRFMVDHGPVIMMVVLVLLGAKVLGEGLGVLG